MAGSRGSIRANCHAHLIMQTLAAIAPIIWAKWGDSFLETLRQEASDAADGLAFQALNSQAGVRTLLVACTTDPARVQAIKEALALAPVRHPVDWESYSAAEMVFRTERGSGLGHQEQRDASGRVALALCATRPAAVQTLERLLDLPE